MSFQNRKRSASSYNTTRYSQRQFETFNSQHVLNLGGSLEEFNSNTLVQALRYSNILHNKLLLNNLVKSPLSAN